MDDRGCGRSANGKRSGVRRDDEIHQAVALAAYEWIGNTASREYTALLLMYKPIVRSIVSNNAPSNELTEAEQISTRARGLGCAYMQTYRYTTSINTRAEILK
ncbi:hypothetical protein J6590_053213 [Homalodisca vitripennis]|nr:hypothetical protein J6590_053213 [Homalodisca vitripennis]